MTKREARALVAELRCKARYAFGSWLYNLNADDAALNRAREYDRQADQIEASLNGDLETIDIESLE